jgi:uncharacterized membrane protein
LKFQDKCKIPSIEEIDQWLSKKSFGYERSTILVFVCIMTYGVILSGTTVLRHRAFMTAAWDLGIFTQSLWTTLNANRFFYHTCELFINPSGSFFGVHFSPILFLVLPLYWLFQTSETLLVLQSFVLAFAAVPLYKLAKDNAGGRGVGMAFVFAYLFYPATHAVNLYDFHVQAFLPLFFFSVIYYATKEKWSRYFLFVFFSLMCDEHAVIIMIFIGIYIAWTHKTTIISAVKRKELAEKKLVVPLVTMTISFFWYCFTLWQRSVFFPTNPEAMSTFLGSSNFSILGATAPIEIPLLVILRPWNAVQALIYNGPIKLLYIALLFGPLAFLSFRKPSTLIPTIPWFTFALMSQTIDHHSIGNQYEAYIVVFIFSAAVFTVREKFRRTPFGLRSVSRSLKRIMLCTFLFFVLASPLGIVANQVFGSPLGIVASQVFGSYASLHRAREISDVLNMIPQNASILTQNNLFPHVSHRVDAYVVPNRFFFALEDTVVDFLNRTIDEVDYILVDSKTDPFATNIILSLLDTKTQFTQIACRDNGTILLYKRVRPTSPSILYTS